MMGKSSLHEAGLVGNSSSFSDVCSCTEGYGAAFAGYICLDLGDFWFLFHNFWVLMMAVHFLTVILASLLVAHESAALYPFLSLPRGVIGVGGIQCTLVKQTLKAFIKSI